MKKRIVILGMLLLPLYMLAQQINVRGIVYDNETKETLPGVSIIVKDTKQGTYSDLDGKFEIKANKDQVLIFSFIGKNPMEMKASGELMKVYLENDINQLEEITISVGYFDVNKKDLSGSISQIKSKELEKIRTNSVEQLIQGQVAGVVVTNSGEPGGGIAISIRGTNSILGGTQPLYVVDGIPIDPISDAQGNGGAGQSQNSLSFMNPNDIDKIEVLKDAAATAVYGARGANGVILITTKSGATEGGKDAITVTIDNFITNTTNRIDVMNGSQFEDYMNQRVTNQFYINVTNPNRVGGPFDGTQALNPTNYPELVNFSLPFPESTGINNDWQDLTYRQAISNNYNLSYRSGDTRRNILMSLGIQETKGVILNTGNKKVTFNLNARTKGFNDKVDIISRTNFAHNKGNAGSVGNGEIFLQRGVVSQAIQFQPIFGLLDVGENDDTYADLNEGNPISNPFTLATQVIDLKESYNFTQNISLSTKITPKFTAMVKGAFNLQRSNRDSYFPTTTARGRRNNGEATQAYVQNQKIYAETSLRFRNNFKGHKVDAILVGTLEQNKIRSLFNKAFGFGSDATTFYEFQSATDILVPISQSREFGLLSGLFRVGYSYKNKYYVDVNTRIDASSKFAENNKSAIFPSIALSWAISKEKFLKNSETISDMKLRMSYGRTGSNPIAPYQSLALLDVTRYNFDNQLVTGYYESNLANDDLTWEKTNQFNTGIDLSLFKSKVNITFDAYYKLTKDLLQNVNLPPSNGFATIVDNFGEVENKGLELSISASLFDDNDFSWDISGNFSLNRNKLVSLNSNLEFQLGPSVGFAQTRPIMFMEGMPLGIFWGAQSEGIYSDWEEANNSGINGAAPGEIIYRNNSIDRDINGNPLAIQEIDFDDYVQIGDPNPDFNVAITNNFKYKNWDASILITGQKGGDLFWVDSWSLLGNNNSRNGLLSAFNDSWKAPLDVNRATSELSYNPTSGVTTGINNPAPVIDGGMRAIVSDRQIYDGSFVRLKNLNIGYTLNFKNTSSLRLYAAGQNLLTWTKYPGYDPEATSYNQDPQRRGVDFGGYPGVQTYTFGLQFNY
jgi:TonB-linked SusC/RagA family outer membrane protein